MTFSDFNKKITGFIFAMIISGMPFHDASAKSKDVCVPGNCPFITNGTSDCNNPAFECPIVCASQKLKWNNNWACYSGKNKLKCEYNELETFCVCGCEKT